MSPILGLVTAVPAGQVSQRVDAADSSMFDLAAARSGWMDEFERFAARHPASDANVVVVAKAVPGTDASPGGAAAEGLAPQDVPKTPQAAATDDALLKTGSIKSAHLPLLPPVPGPEAFKVHKGDRLGVPQRTDTSHTAPSSTESAPDASAVTPHAELAPTKANGVIVPAVKSAMLLPARHGRLKPLVTESVAMRPMNLAPGDEDSLFQGPPAPPADPAVDPDAPVLGYAEQMASAEAPFKSLFAVTPVTKHAWLGVDNAPPEKAKAKPAKLAHLAPHRRPRKHQVD